MTFLAKIFGTKSDREIKKILPIVNQVNQFYDTLKDKDISYLQSRTKELQVIIKKSILKKRGMEFYQSYYRLKKNKLPIIDAKIALSNDYFTLNKKNKC